MAIGTQLAATRVHDGGPWVLVVDKAAKRRMLVASAFRAAGCRVKESAAASDAMRVLGSDQVHGWVIAIADTNPASEADELGSHLHAAHPSIPVIVIGGRRATSIAGRIRIDHVPDLATQVHRLVETRHAG
jgi:DNA-binding NtrC family response regulator